MTEQEKNLAKLAQTRQSAEKGKPYTPAGALKSLQTNKIATIKP